MTILEIPGLQEAIANQNRPAIPEGKYLAVIQSAEVRVNVQKQSMGLMWSVLVNTNPEALAEGWDADARTYPIKNYYTFLGRIGGDGRLTNTDNSFKATEVLAALGIKGGAVDLEDVKYRQIIVTIKHKADDRDEGLENPRLWPRIDEVLRYTVGDEVAPKLKALAEMAAANAPATTSVSNEPEF